MFHAVTLSESGLNNRLGTCHVLGLFSNILGGAGAALVS